MARIGYMLVGTYINVGRSTTNNTTISTFSDNQRQLPFMYDSSSSSNGTGFPSLSFPLGTGLVLVAIVFISAVFSFFYHWLRMRKLVVYTTNQENSINTNNINPLYQYTQSHQINQDGSELAIPILSTKQLQMVPCPPVVYMAGEEMPRFIAFPCPFKVELNDLDDYDMEANASPIMNIQSKYSPLHGPLLH